jgi:hypothetical protein
MLKNEKQMPAKSKAQQRAMGAALAAKQRKAPMASVARPAKQMAK